MICGFRLINKIVINRRHSRTILRFAENIRELWIPSTEELFVFRGLRGQRETEHRNNLPAFGV